MLRHTQRLCRLTFEALLCGAHPQLPPPQHLTEACVTATEQFTSQCSSSAPAPVALAAATVASLLLQRRLRDAAGVLAVHPRQPQLLRAVREYVDSYPDVFALATLRDMSEEVRCVGETAVSTFLEAAVHRFLSEAASPSLDEGSGECETAEGRGAQRQELRGLVVRHIRFHPACASSLLRPLCLVSEGTAGECEDVVMAMQVAMKQQSINPADFGHVLEVLLRAGNAHRVAQMWEWMQHTSACWDVRATSAAVTAFAQLGKMDEAVACMQRLAEAGIDPSIEAQVRFVRFLGERTPPMAQYADQLVRHWFPTAEQLWCGEGQEVGVELLVLRSRCGLHREAVALMEEASAATSSQPQEARRLLLHPQVAALAQRYAKRVAESAALQRLFFETVLESPSVAESHPDLAGMLLSIGLAAHRLPDVYAVLEKVSLGKDSFLQAINFLARGSSSKTTEAGELLACMEEAAARTSNVVPSELKAWLQLAKEM